MTSFERHQKKFLRHVERNSASVPYQQIADQLREAEKQMRESLRELMMSPCPATGDKESHDWESISWGWCCKRCGTTVEC